MVHWGVSKRCVERQVCGTSCVWNVRYVECKVCGMPGVLHLCVGRPHLLSHLTCFHTDLTCFHTSPAFTQTSPAFTPHLLSHRPHLLSHRPHLLFHRRDGVEVEPAHERDQQWAINHESHEDVARRIQPLQSSRSHQSLDKVLMGAKSSLNR